VAETGCNIQSSLCYKINSKRWLQCWCECSTEIKNDFTYNITHPPRSKKLSWTSIKSICKISLKTLWRCFSVSETGILLSSAPSELEDEVKSCDAELHVAVIDGKAFLSSFPEEGNMGSLYNGIEVKPMLWIFDGKQLSFSTCLGSQNKMVSCRKVTCFWGRLEYSA